MKKSEAVALLKQYAPELAASKKPIDTLLDAAEAKGHTVGIDNLTGEWIVCDNKRNDHVYARVACTRGWLDTIRAKLHRD